MSKITNAGRSMLALLLLIGVGLVPMLSGLLVMVFQLERKLEDNATISVQEAVFSIDKALDLMHEAALRALPLAGKPCDSVIRPLQDQVANLSMLRSLTLTQDNEPYCGSFSDSLPYLSGFTSSGRQVGLAHVISGGASKLLINYHLRNEKRGVVVTAFDSLLRSELKGFQDGLTLLLEFDGHYIWAGGDSRDPHRPSQSEFTASAISTKYGYKVIGGYAQGFTAQEIRQSVGRILPSLVLVGVVTGLIVYLSLFRAMQRKRGTAASGT